MSIDLADTVAVITGGAAGIGLAAAHRFGLAGSHVVIADVDDQALDTARRDLDVAGTAVTAVRVDVRRHDDQQQLLDVATSIGPMGALMLNAGISAGGALEHVPLQQWRDLFEVNVFGVVDGLNTFIPTLVEQQRRSHVVITGSTASLSSNEAGVDAPYVASKHALLGVARAYRNYLAPHDVGVQLLAPRMTDTAFPRSSIAWGRRGSRVVGDRDLGPADTADHVADTLLTRLGSRHLVIALDDDTANVAARFATDDIVAPE